MKTTRPPITVVIADSQKTRRATCVSILQPEKRITVIGEVRSGLDALLATGRLKPRVLLLNYNFLKGKKMLLLSALRRKSPKTKVILLTRGTPEGQILETLCNGARGYIEEKDLRRFLPKAIRRVNMKKVWVPRKMIARMVDLLSRLTGQHSCNPQG